MVLDILTRRRCGRQQVRVKDPFYLTVSLPYIATLGGWWTRPSNWKANTAILFAGILTITYGAWTVSADREVRVYFARLKVIFEHCDFGQWRYVEPARPIPSQQVRSGILITLCCTKITY